VIFPAQISITQSGGRIRVMGKEAVAEYRMMDEHNRVATRLSNVAYRLSHLTTA
jgi:hypothetical protein